MSTEKWQTVLCFWCQQPRGDRSLADPDDHRTEVITDYVPCAECARQRSEGIFIAEVAVVPQAFGQPSLAEGLPGANITDGLSKKNSPPVYPTGNWLVFDPAGVRLVFPDVIAEIAETQRQLLFDEGMYRKFFPSSLLDQIEEERMISEGGLQ